MYMVPRGRGTVKLRVYEGIGIYSTGILRSLKQGFAIPSFLYKPIFFCNQHPLSVFESVGRLAGQPVRRLVS